MRYLLLIFWMAGSPVFGAVKSKVPQPFPYPKYTFEWFDEDCDTCGCSGNGGSMGFGTGLDNNFMGLRYIGQQYRSRDGIFNNSPWIDEHFNTVQLWAKIPLGNRFAINALLPFHFHNRDFSDGSLQEITGVGDATLLAFYKMIKPLPDSIVPINPVHDLQLGGGFKVPTGSFDQANLEGSVNPSFQVGTGSWDYVMAANYGLTYRNWGIMALVNYTVKSTNSAEYRFGNQLNYALNYYKTYYAGRSWSFTPQVGLGGESFAENESSGMSVSNTGGQVLFGRLGVEAKYQNLALGVSGMLPITQNLNNGKVEVVNRVSVYLNLNI